MKPPRIFQIYKTIGDDDTIWSAIEDSGNYENSIAVIELKAYDDLMTDLCSLHKLIHEMWPDTGLLPEDIQLLENIESKYNDRFRT